MVVLNTNNSKTASSLSSSGGKISISSSSTSASVLTTTKPIISSSSSSDPDSLIMGYDNSSVLISATAPQYAVLKYGDNANLLFNINCQVQHLMDYFMVKCKETVANLDRDNLDLSDLEGNLKGINRDAIARKRLSSDYLRPREAYVLVEVKTITLHPPSVDVTKGHHHSTLHPQPIYFYQARPLLVNNGDIVTPSFLAKLAPKIPKNYQQQLQHRNNTSGRLSSHRNSVASSSHSTSPTASTHGGGGEKTPHHGHHHHNNNNTHSHHHTNNHGSTTTSHHNGHNNHHSGHNQTTHKAKHSTTKTSH